MNKAMLIGRLGKDAEKKQFDNGVLKCSFTLATSERHTDKDSGEKKEVTEWHNIVAWGKLGELCGQYCKKGDLVYVEGKIKNNVYEDNGVKKNFTTIEAQKVEFLTRREEKSAEMGNKTTERVSVAEFSGNVSSDDEGLPF